MGLAAKTNEKFEACRSARWELEIGVSIGGLRGWPGPMRARGGHSFGVRAAAVAAGSLRGRSCRYAALLPVLRERADRGGGTALPPFRLQHLPLCAQHHPQGGSQSPAPGRGTSCRPLASYHRVVSPPAPSTPSPPSLSLPFFHGRFPSALPSRTSRIRPFVPPQGCYPGFLSLPLLGLLAPLWSQQRPNWSC